MPQQTDPATIVLPAGQPGRPAGRRRRRGIGWVVALLVIAVLLVVAFFVGEGIARDYATERIRAEVASAFDLAPTHPMDVDIGGGLLLPQAVGGSLEEVTVRIDEVPFGDLAGGVTLAATGVPLDPTRPTSTLRGSVTVDEANVQKLRPYLSDLEIDSIALAEGSVDVATTFSRFGLQIPVTAGVEPGVADGQLVFSPRTVTVNGAELSLEALADSPFGAFADAVLPTRSFCVAEFLPRAVVLQGVDVSPRALVLGFAADGAALGGEAMSTNGSCP